MKKISILLALIFATGYSCYASGDQEGIFLRDAPHPGYIDALRSAFINRRWTVVSESDSSIEAYLNHRGINAKLTVTQEGNFLLYNCVCTKKVTKNQAGGRKTTNAIEYTPGTWLDNLRKDTGLYFNNAMIGSQPKTSSIEERLIKLKSLLDKKLLTEFEYKQRRNEILSEL